jgi:hypothetical protein
MNMRNDGKPEVDLDFLDTHHVEHVEMVLPHGKRASDREEYLEEFEAKSAKITEKDFESVGFSEGEFAREFESWKPKEFKKLHTKDLVAGDIFRVVLDIDSVSVFLKVQTIRGTSAYGHVFWMIPHPEGGSLVKKVSNSRKVVMPLYQ